MDNAACFVDWLDADSEPRQNGAESDFYSADTQPYLCKNAPLDSIGELLHVKSITREPMRGVTVDYNGQDIDIEIHIIVEYGTRINSVAESVANTVRYHVEKALGLKVNAINVDVAGLRVSNMD